METINPAVEASKTFSQPEIDAENVVKIERNKVPKHVAIIMDGNGRWATSKGWNRSLGHAQGTATVKDIIREADRLGVKILTLYCFSTENWGRPAAEIEMLMKLLRDYLVQETQELIDNNIKLNALGQTHRIPKEILDILNNSIGVTSQNTGMILNFCISYGGRAEILRAVQQSCRDYADGKIQLSDIDDEYFSNHLYTAGMPDPDVVIRTSGESRISNFLLWQLAYSEIMILDTPWPDFTPAMLGDTLKQFSKRKRRFGNTDESL
ncbi:isoprenyl transferase [bacterium]|nr:isoprenyl transferase [bacterium]